MGFTLAGTLFRYLICEVRLMKYWLRAGWMSMAIAVGGFAGSRIDGAHGYGWVSDLIWFGIPMVVALNLRHSHSRFLPLRQAVATKTWLGVQLPPAAGIVSLIGASLVIHRAPTDPHPIGGVIVLVVLAVVGGLIKARQPQEGSNPASSAHSSL